MRANGKWIKRDQKVKFWCLRSAAGTVAARGAGADLAGLPPYRRDGGVAADVGDPRIPAGRLPPGSNTAGAVGHPVPLPAAVSCRRGLIQQVMRPRHAVHLYDIK
jgi:hypothetical protein